MNFWKTKSFKELQRTWYQQLQKEGFQDAEEPIGDEMVLKQSAAHPYHGADQLVRTSKEAYYRLLSQQVQEAEFRSEVDRIILTMFAEGSPLKSIREAISKLGMVRCRNTITFTIRKYEMRWGLREYSPRQLNRKEVT